MIFYCADGNFVAWDNIILEEAHAAYGDFAVATLFASQWSGHVQDLLGVPFTLKTGPHKACLTGAYIGNVYRQSRPSRSSSGCRPATSTRRSRSSWTTECSRARTSACSRRCPRCGRGFFDGADSCLRLLPKQLRP